MPFLCYFRANIYFEGWNNLQYCGMIRLSSTKSTSGQLSGRFQEGCCDSRPKTSTQGTSGQQGWKMTFPNSLYSRVLFSHAASADSFAAVHQHFQSCIGDFKSCVYMHRRKPQTFKASPFVLIHFDMPVIYDILAHISSPRQKKMESLWMWQENFAYCLWNG